ncbi:MAG: hypothetical protein M3R61_21430 [Chloroflexota bacterium]|nr:hypothetical protein [Chloroflexota bacterium]
MFTGDDDYFFGLLHSKLHELWARGTGTQLREAESGFRYTPTTCFETFPFPWPPGHEPHGDTRIEAIGEAARELVRQRDEWLAGALTPQLPLPGAGEGKSRSDGGEGNRGGDGSNSQLPVPSLKDRTLTNLYNKRPDWLDLAHRRLDQAVFAAYGWPDDLSDEEILARLLALNLERAAGQVAVVANKADGDDV